MTWSESWPWSSTPLSSFRMWKAVTTGDREEEGDEQCSDMAVEEHRVGEGKPPVEEARGR